MKKKQKRNLPPKTINNPQNNAQTPRLVSQKDLKTFGLKSLIVAFFLVLGLLVPGFWIANFLFKLKLSAYEPHTAHFLYLSLASLPGAALLYLLGIRKIMTPFIGLMIFLFLYGVFLPLFLCAIAGLIIFWVISPLTGFEMRDFSVGTNLVLTLISLGYGVYAFFSQSESFQEDYQAAGGNSLAGDVVAAVDNFWGDSASDSDSGGSDGGD